MMSDNLGFYISGKDLWDKLEQIGKAVEGLPQKVEDHETRIRALERKVMYATGFAAAVGGVLGTSITRLIGG